MKKKTVRTEQQKAEILKEAKHLGVAAAAKKYGVGQGLIYLWRTKAKQEPKAAKASKGFNIYIPSAKVEQAPMTTPTHHIVYPYTTSATDSSSEPYLKGPDKNPYLIRRTLDSITLEGFLTMMARLPASTRMDVLDRLICG
jgi:hypothetical protein